MFWEFFVQCVQLWPHWPVCLLTTGKLSQLAKGAIVCSFALSLYRSYWQWLCTLWSIWTTGKLSQLGKGAIVCCFALSLYRSYCQWLCTLWSLLLGHSFQSLLPLLFIISLNLSTMSLNLATLWSFCPLCPESHSCSLWTVTWPLLFTMPCNLATLVHYAVLLGLSCSLCPGTWPLLSTMSWNLATLVNYVLELGHSWPLLSTMSWKLATLGRSCLLFPGTWPLLALLTLDLTTLGCLLFSELITLIVKSTNESFRNL